MILKLVTCAVFLMTAAFACEVLPPRPPQGDDPTAYPPSSYGDSGGNPCERACANLARLHCPESAATDAGETCAQLCIRIEGQGFDLHDACVARATSVAAVQACGVRCAP